MTAPTERALDKAYELLSPLRGERLEHEVYKVAVLVVARALDAERASVWEELDDTIDLVDALKWNVPRRKNSAGLHARADAWLEKFRARASSLREALHED